jgi:hypothetical protein
MKKIKRLNSNANRKELSSILDLFNISIVRYMTIDDLRELRRLDHVVNKFKFVSYINVIAGQKLLTRCL